MLTKKAKITAGLSLAFVGAFALSSCSGAATDTADTTDTTPAPMATESMAPETDMAMGELVGPGCAAYAEAVPTGAGSVEGMSQDPVATAASNNPILTTLTAAVSGQLNPDVDLVDTLNSGEFTVFAPVDDAFAMVDPATIDTLSTDADLLTQVLTYHVVQGQVGPDDIAGTHATLQGADVEVTGSGDSIMVNGSASVICGGVETANATVYLIDEVLMPPME